MVKKIWKNLLSDKCPKCGCGLVRDKSVFKCALWVEIPQGTFDCDFIISLGTLEGLKIKLKNGQYFSQMGKDNLEGLNNL